MNRLFDLGWFGRTLCALLASGLVLATAHASAQVDMTLPQPGDAVGRSFDELLTDFVRNAPEIVRGRLTVEQSRSQVDASLALLEYVLTTRLNSTRAEQPTNDGLSSGLSTTERTQLGADLVRRFRPGTQVQLTLDNSVTSSAFPFSSPAGTQIIERGPNFESSLTLSANQPLLEGFGERIYMLPMMQAQRRLEAAELQVVQQASARLLELVTGAVELRYSMQELEVRHRSLQRTLEQLTIGQAELQAGRIAAIELDLLRQRAAANQEAILVAWASAQARTLTLATVVGSNPGSSDVWNLEPPAVQLPTEIPNALCAAANEFSPDVAALRAQVESARVETVRANDALRPSLDLNAGLTQRGLESNVPGAFGQLFRFEATTIFGGLVFTLPLGNRQARDAANQARLAVEQAEYEVGEAGRQLCVQVHEIAANLQLLNSRSALAAYRVDIASRSMMAEQARFAQGLSTVQNGLQALEDLETVELETLRLQTDVELGRWRLAHLSGQLMARWLPEYQQWLADPDATSVSDE
jgi:outer membrane protein TolC